MSYIELNSDGAERAIKVCENKLAKLLNLDPEKIDVLEVGSNGDLEVCGVWGTVEAHTLQGNCGTLVVNEFSFMCFQGQRVDAFVLILDLIRSLAKQSDYGYMLATTTTHQKEERSAFKKAGWKVIRRFKNPRSSNTIQIWGRAMR